MKFAVREALGAQPRGELRETVDRQRDADLPHVRREDHRRHANLSNGLGRLGDGEVRGTFQFGNRQGVDVDQLDERSLCGSRLHLGDRHVREPAHRVGDDHVLHTLSMALADQHQAFFGSRVARGEHQPMLGDDRDHILDLR